MADKVSEAEQQQKHAAPGTKGTKSKAVERDGVRGSWFPYKPDEAPIKILVDEGFLKRDLIHYTPEEAAPVPPSGFVVMCRAWVDRGLSLPPSKFFLDVLELYKLQLHNICSNGYTIMANFQALMEGHLGVEADVRLFQWYFSCRPEYEEGKGIYNCGSSTFMLRNRRKYPTYPTLDSIRYWNRNWFYHKNLEIEGKASRLPKFKDGPAQVLDSWKNCVNIDDHQHLLTMARRIGKLVDWHGSDVTLSWLKRRIQPLQF